jgi:formylglycine-generating enzyme required for sulfatase activity
MKVRLTLVLLFTALSSQAQYDKFRKAEGPVSSHAYAGLGSIGYAYQRGHFLQLALIYGTNYNHVNNSLKNRIDNLKYDVKWDYAVFGIGAGADIGIVQSGMAFGPKLFAEFETHQKMLLYRINVIQYFVNGGHDMRIMPEFGVYFGKKNHLAVLAGYSQPVAKQIKDISRLKIGLNVYPGLLNGITYKIAKEQKADAEAFKPAPGIKAPEMVLVQGGTFKMGANIDKYKYKSVLNVMNVPGDEKPEHEVTMPDYYIGKNEVTVAEFREFVKQTGYVTEKERINKINKGIFYRLGILKNRQGSCFWNGLNWQNKHLVWTNDVLGNNRADDQDNHPVIYVTVNDALKYCEWLSVQTGKKYRLPTEAEWEYAASGGNQNNNFIFPGSDSLDEVAWHKGNSRKSTHMVGLKKPNELGIYDMAGNVMEMCSDWYDAHYYEKTALTNPQGPEQSSTIIRYYSIRGSSWAAGAADSRTTRRNFCEMGTASNCLGFRVVAEK